MTSNELALNIFSQGKDGKWLSVKQTAFLKNLADKEEIKSRGACNRKESHGRFQLNGLTYNWHLFVSPVNQCGLFRTDCMEDNAAKWDKEQAEKVASLQLSLKGAYQLLQIFKAEGYSVEMIEMVERNIENLKNSLKFMGIEA